MMKSILVCLCAVLFLAGCQRTPEEQVAFETKRAANVIRVDELNQKNLSNPITVGKTKNGQLVTLANVKFICETCDGNYPADHYVYMFDGTVSDNYTYRSGKASYQKTEVFLKYNPTPEQVIEEGERLRKSIEDTEKAELARLKEKYPDKQ